MSDFVDPTAVPEGSIGQQTAMGMLGHLPHLYTTQPWNWGRGGDTILRGARRNMLSGNPGAIRSTLSPRYLSRLGSLDAVGGIGDGYSPFQLANMADRFLGGAGKGRNALRAKIGMGAPSSSERNPMFTSGLMSRVTAASKLGAFGGGEARVVSKTTVGNVAKFMDAHGIGKWAQVPKPDLPPMLQGAGRALNMADDAQRLSYFNNGPVATNKQLAAHILSSTKGNVTSRMSGYAAGLIGDEGAVAAAVRARTASGFGASASYFQRGASAAASHLAPGSLSAAAEVSSTAAAKYGMARTLQGAMNFVPGLNVLMKAKLVYDIAAMGGELVKGAGKLAGDAVTSFKGDISKAPMGMGFRDNEVAATSRARGVAAIQNSRLNARSALGSEANMMYSRFG